MASVPAERREYRRCVFPSTLEYVMKPEAGGRTFKGVALNISESGICIYTSNELEEGQVVSIISVLPVPSRKAVVRWTRSLNEDVCKAGLMFVK